MKNDDDMGHPLMELEQISDALAQKARMRMLFFKK